MFLSEDVLVIVDFRQSNHHALPRALKLASQFGCRLTVVTCIYQNIVDVISKEGFIDLNRIRDEAVEHYTEEISKLIVEYTKEYELGEMTPNVEVFWHKSFHDGVLDYIENHHFDLIIKTARSHSTIDKLFFTSTDWRLLRETTINILFVKNGIWPSASNIVGTINIDEDEAHQRLNQKIIKTTVAIAKACHSQPYILNVFPWTHTGFSHFKTLFDKTDQFLKIKKEHQQALRSYVDNYPILQNNLIVAEGLEPAETIPEVVRSSVAGLLVIGCVCRKGFSGMVVGNTVEKILDDIHCEVLVIK